ncbi:AraC family transcriptional regulator [Shewanella sp. 5_MG-2023]|uniref:AraC family transcriptional regulator n=1 Tax=Shewanella sp. 5_MG-2023 TaxID=3062656 RepID=UPI0026E3F7B0|nr:AraC family transcriptional regulator [Shewanella sp. 5_MG-2023]MDO6639289.1 AraC family transcriptional regulator [Shewanella sp. 5_MG-2023]
MKDLHAQFEVLLSYIDNNLPAISAFDDNLNSRLAAIAGVAEVHFGALFYSLFHTKVQDYIRLLKNLEAAQLLGFDKTISLDTVALKMGYPSTAAFITAFTDSIGQSPQSFQASPDWGNFFAKQQPLSTLAEGHEQFSAAEVNIQASDLTATELVVIKHRGPACYLSQSKNALNAFRQKYHLSPSTSRTFNFVYDMPYPQINALTDDQSMLSLDIGVSVNQAKLTELAPVIAESGYFSNKSVAKGRYAQFYHLGSEKELNSKIKYLYSHWLAASDWTLTTQPLIIERLDVIKSEAVEAAIADDNQELVEVRVYLKLQ